MTKITNNNEPKIKRSASSANAPGKANKVSPLKDIVIKEEQTDDDEDSFPGTLGSLSALIARAKGD